MERLAQKTLIDQTIAKLEALAATEIHIRSRIVMIKVLAHPAVAKGELIHCFPPSPASVDTRESIDSLLAMGKRVVLAVPTEAGELTHVAIDNLDALDGLTSGDVSRRGDTIDPGDLDAVIVPGVVYGRDGSRLGAQSESYDSFLAGVTCPRIAPVFDLQLASLLDWTEGMSRVDVIIGETTEYGIDTAKS